MSILVCYLLLGGVPGLSLLVDFHIPLRPPYKASVINHQRERSGHKLLICRVTNVPLFTIERGQVKMMAKYLLTPGQLLSTKRFLHFPSLHLSSGEK